MQLTRFRLFLLCGGSLLLLGPAVGLGQFQGPPGAFQPPGGMQPGAFQPPGNAQPGSTPGRQGRQGRQFDPNMIFNMLSGGKDYIAVADWLPMATARDPGAADKINAFLQRAGITNGQLTRDQFAQFMQERQAQRQADRAADPNTPKTDAPTTSTDAPTTDDGTPIPEDKRSVVYRVGNLPQGLPTWFASMDTDRDGQVGMYEWKAQGRAISDFQTIDLNGDGFITVEEALRYQKSQGVAVASTSPAPFPGAPSFNGQPSNGFNQFGNRSNRGNRGTPGNPGTRGNRPGRGQ